MDTEKHLWEYDYREPDDIGVDTMVFEWLNDSGKVARLEVEPYYYFPCTRKVSKELSPLLSQDKRQELLDYLEKSQEKSIEYQRELSKEWSNLHDKISEHTKIIASGKWANGVYLTKDELDRAKRNLGYIKDRYKETTLKLQKLKTRIAKYSQNLKDFAKAKEVQ